jgi:hypothetical protein
MALNVTWPGQSGKTYTFETHPIGTEFNPASGVYIACKRSGNLNWDALYVGETQSFHDRLNTGLEDHDGLKCARRNGATHLGVMIVHGNANRLSVETELRHVLDPACNRQPVSNPASLFYRR